MPAGLGKNQRVDWDSINNKDDFISHVNFRLHSLIDPNVSIAIDEVVSLLKAIARLGINSPGGDIGAGTKVAIIALLEAIIRANP